MFLGWSEADIKQAMYLFLQAEDITAELRAEILYILAGAETALTMKQQKQLYEFLSEDYQ